MQRLLFLSLLALSQLAIGQSIPLQFPETVRLAARASFKHLSEIQTDSLLESVANYSWKQKKQHNIEAALFAVALVPSGRALLQAMLPLVMESKLEIATVAKSGGTAGYYEDGKIYVDNEVPFVALVATLFHEGTHAVDWLSAVDGPARWKIFSTTRSWSVAAPLLLSSEWKSYSAQNQFVQELAELDESIKHAVEYAVTFRYLLDHPLTLETFQMLMIRSAERGGYGLPTGLIESFVEKQKL